MSADIILADFRTKTYHKPDPITLERMAAEILAEVEKALDELKTKIASRIVAETP